MSLKPSEQQRLLDQLARCYAIEQSQLRCLTDNPEDGVYGFTQQGQAFVLKYTLPTPRTDSSWVIDFDACTYHWSLLDIATTLYFTLWERPAALNNAAFAAFVLEHLVAGYRREQPLEPSG